MRDEPTSASASGKPDPPEDLSSLIATANRAAAWSATADQLKRGVDRARTTVFLLSIIGAAAATIAGQMPATGSLRTIAAVSGAGALGVAALLSGRLLQSSKIAPWLQARAASEALKREAFRYAASASPYNEPATADDLLDEERQKIDAGVSDIFPIKAERQGSAPREKLAPEAYRARRVQAQIEQFYRPKAEAAHKKAKGLRWCEFLLALLAAIITAVSSATGKMIPLTAINFDLAALTALLTTIGAVVLAHLEGTRLEYLAASYAAAARRLEDQNTKFVSAIAGDWSGFVNRCEDIIAAENQSWIAKWTQAKGSDDSASQS